MTPGASNDYADRCGADEAHLILFDRRPDVPWDEEVYRLEQTHRGRPTLWGM